MAFDISMRWQKPIKIKKKYGVGTDLTSLLEQLEDVHAVYVFGRKNGKKVAPIYIGQTKRLKTRIKSHLTNTIFLEGLNGARKGLKYLYVAIPEPKRGQDKNKIIRLVETALIRHATAENHDLINQKGTKEKTHSMRFMGDREAQTISGGQMKMLSR